MFIIININKIYLLKTKEQKSVYQEQAERINGTKSYSSISYLCTLKLTFWKSPIS